MMEEVEPSLYLLWKQEHLVDLVLQTADGSVLAHRVVLAAASDYIRALLTGPWSETMVQADGLPVVRLDGVDHSALLLTLHAVYRQRVDVTWATCEPLLATASFLGIHLVQDACRQFLEAELDPGTCMTVLTLAARYNDPSLHDHAMALSQSWFERCAVAGLSRDLQAMPDTVLTELLGSNLLRCSSEKHVLEALALWLEGDVALRQEKLPQLLRIVRMPQADIVTAVAELEERHVVGQAALEALGDAAQRLEGGNVRFARRRSSPTRLMVAGGRDSTWLSIRRAWLCGIAHNWTVELYDPQQDAWTLTAPLPGDCPFAGAAEFHDGVVVVSGAVFRPVVAFFDAERAAWSHWPHLRTPRVQSALVALSDDIFVLGGRTSASDSSETASVEVFSAGRHAWHPASPMTAARHAHAAAALGGRVYAVGGQNSRAVHASCEWRDVGSGHWFLDTPMSIERKYTAAAVHAGRLYVVGGMTASRQRLASMEALDPREGTWATLPPMALPRSSCAAATLQEQLYVVGGSSSNDSSLSSVEAFVPAAGKWLPRSVLGTNRSGHAVCAF